MKRKKLNKADEFPPNLWNPLTLYDLVYTDTWESIERDDPRLGVISYDRMILSNTVLESRKDIVTIQELIDKINGANHHAEEGVESNDKDRLESVISSKVWKMVVTRMLMQFYAVCQYNKVNQIDSLDSWWDDRRKTSEKLLSKIAQFEFQSSSHFEALKIQYDTRRTLYSKKHAYDSDFLNWMRDILPKNGGKSQEGKVFEVSNIDINSVGRQSIIEFFSKYGTILHMSTSVENQKSLKVCMKNSSEVDRIMEQYLKRKQLSLGGKILSLRRISAESEKTLLNKVGRSLDKYLRNRIDNHDIIMKTLIDEANLLDREKTYWVTKTATNQLGLNTIKRGKFKEDTSTLSISQMIEKNEEKKASLEAFTETSDFFFSFSSE